jgi:hypothetical protein
MRLGYEKLKKYKTEGNVFDNRNRNYFDVLVLITSFCKSQFNAIQLIPNTIQIRAIAY